jgi:hypothetical protein
MWTIGATMAGKILTPRLTVSGDSGIVNKDVRAIVAPYEAISLGLIEPLHDSTHFRLFGLKLHRSLIIRERSELGGEKRPPPDLADL